MGLEIKIPKFKFPKFKFKEIDDVEDINLEKEKEKTEKNKKDKKQYEGTHYKTIKDAFNYSTEHYADNVLILEKPDHKTPYKEITYKEFGEDVINFGTGLTKFLNLKDERIVIISETTYGWYLSYMTLLCGAGIAVPLDKELPVNEIENLIKRSKATAVIYSAKKLGYKTLIHEQNSIPGKANLFLSKYADRIAVSFKSTIKEFPEYKTIFTGNPCGENAINAKAIEKQELGLMPNKKLVLFVMGSLGSSKVNEILVKTMKLFNKKDYEILFITGNDDYEKIKQNKFPSNVHVVAYVENLIRVMKKTDLIVSRAGASTLSEIIALSLPSILIPSPYVPDNHQFKNAKDLIDKKAALLIEEKNLKGDILVRTIDDVINNEDKINEIKNNLKEFKIENSATLIYNNIKEIVDGSK